MYDLHRFAVLGPFSVPTKRERNRRLVDFSIATERVFEPAEEQSAAKIGLTGVRNAIGCYLFALKPPGGPVIWPYYVGQSCRQTLAKRIFQASDKPRVYNAILNEYSRATAFVYLLPLLTSGGRFAKIGSNQNIIDNAEYSLIGMALRVNTDLWNIQHRVSMESFTIDGTPQNAGRRDTTPAASFRRMLGFADYPKRGRTRGEVQPQPQEATVLDTANFEGDSVAVADGEKP